MFENLKNVINSALYTQRFLKKGCVFYGAANTFLDTQYYPGTDNWKSSAYSYKVVVESVENGLVHFYEYYITETGDEFNRNRKNYSDIKSFIKKIRKLKLIIG